jgi:hypothetical protein
MTVSASSATGFDVLGAVEEKNAADLDAVITT